MKKRLVLLAILFALSAGCQNSFDLSQIKIEPLANPQLTFASMMQERCPRCDAASILKGGDFVVFAVAGTISPAAHYGDQSFSPGKIKGSAWVKYCRNCGFLDGDATAELFTLAGLSGRL